MSRPRDPVVMDPGPLIEDPPPLPARGLRRRKITAGKRERILARDGRRCRDCGSTQDLTIDHVVPVSKGGSNRDRNLRILCSPCN